MVESKALCMCVYIGITFRHERTSISKYINVSKMQTHAHTQAIKKKKEHKMHFKIEWKCLYYMYCVELVHFRYRVGTSSNIIFFLRRLIHHRNIFLRSVSVIGIGSLSTYSDIPSIRIQFKLCRFYILLTFKFNWESTLKYWVAILYTEGMFLYTFLFYFYNETENRCVVQVYAN